MRLEKADRDGTAELVSRNQILWRERGQRNTIFPYSADYSVTNDNHTHIHPRPAFSATKRTITLQSVLIHRLKFLKATRDAEMRKIEIPRSMAVEALSW